MKSLFIILLAGYAVRSDENNYYVIEMQDVPPTHKAPVHAKKPFDVYWNVPTMQCVSKKIYFENLYENFGIIQNSHDRFKGENITILYDPGLFPALFKNESNGKIRFRNGGVPQEGNLSKHLDEFKAELDRSIPDKKFSGVAIIDFESWRPQFRQNFGVLQPYKDVSFQIERKLHWWWKEAWIKEEAKRRFEEGARTFMQSTLSVGKQLRPLARWGFYGFPYCFNMASNNLVERCADGVPRENDEISWLWRESSALFPSVYSSVQLSGAQLAALVRGRLREAARCAGAAPAAARPRILPYFWYRYRDSGYLTETDLSSALSMLYKSAATGFIIWGSSNDVNTVEKCNNLKRYVDNVLGPAIAKYTKPSMRDNEEQEESTTLATDTDTKSPPNLDLILDPEFHWIPPDNYTHNLINDVEDHINRRFAQNVTNKDDYSVLQNNSVLTDLILNAVLNIDNTTTTTENPKTKYDKKNQQENDFIVGTTESSVNISTDTSQVTSNLITNNPLINKTNETKNETSESQTTDMVSSETPNFTETMTHEDKTSEFEETDEINTDLQFEMETVDFVNNKTTTDKEYTEQTQENEYDATLDDDDDDFDNTDLLFLFYNTERVTTVDDQTTDIYATSSEITNNEKEIQTITQGLLKTKDIETSTGMLTDTTTTDISDILEIQSTEFFDDISLTENDTYYEDTDEIDFATESYTDLIYNSTEYVSDNFTKYPTIILPSTVSTNEGNEISESSTNVERNSSKEFSEFQYTSSILTTTPARLEYTEYTNIPSEVQNVENTGLNISEATESEDKDETNPWTSPDTTESEATEASSIEPSTDQVIY